MSSATSSGTRNEGADLEIQPRAAAEAPSEAAAQEAKPPGPPPAPARPPAAGPQLGEALRRATSLGSTAAETRELWARVEALEPLLELMARTQDDLASLHAEQALLRDALVGAQDGADPDTQRDAELQRLEQELAESRDELAAARREASDLERAVVSHLEHIRRRDEEMAQLRQALAHREESDALRDEEAAALRESLASARRCADAEQEQARRFREGLAAAEQSLAERIREAVELREELIALQNAGSELEVGAEAVPADRTPTPPTQAPVDRAPFELVEILRGGDEATEPVPDPVEPPSGGWKVLAGEPAAEPLARAPSPGAALAPASPDDDDEAEDPSLAEPPGLPTIYHHWKSRQIREKLALPGVENVDDFFLHYLVDVCRRHPGETVPVVSVGTGSRDLEVVLARRALDAGVSNFNLHCLSPVPTGVSRPRAIAAEPTVLSHLTLVQCSGDAWPLEPHYRLCILNDSLHRLKDPESWLDRVVGALAPGGRVVTSTPVGDVDRDDSPVAQEIVAQIWQLMPDRYRATSSPADAARVAAPVGPAPSILPLLLDAFHIEVFAAFGNVIHAFVDSDIGPNFDPALDRDRRFIEQVAALDDSKIDAGLIPPTQMLGVLRTEPTPRPVVFRHWTPEFCLGREAPPSASSPPGPEDAAAPRA